MKEKISCFDIDGTLSEGMLFVPLVKSEHENGYLSTSAFTHINGLLAAYATGELEYEDTVENLLQTHAEGLRGQKHHDLKAHAEKFLESHEKELFHKFGREVVQLLRTKHRLFVVTAEAQYLAEAVADMYGIHGHISSVYAEMDGQFTGKVERSLAHRTAKASLLQNYDIEFAFGDSEGDIDMLGNATFPYAITPTKGLELTARNQKWHIFDGNDTKDIINSIKQQLN